MSASKYQKIGAVLRQLQLPTDKRECNVYVSVVSWDAPKKTAGTDFSQTLYVCDPEEVPNLGDVHLIVFASHRDLLPNPHSALDILCLHRASLGTWKDKAQITLKVNVSTKPRVPPAFWSLYPGPLNPEGKTGGPQANRPYSSASNTYRVTEEDLAELRRMRSATAPGPPDPGALGCLPPCPAPLSQLCRLEELVLTPPMPAAQSTPPPLVDLFCKVVAIDRRSPGHLVLFVWDATDCPPLPQSASQPFSFPSEALTAELHPPLLRRALPLRCSPGPEGHSSGAAGGTLALDQLPVLGSVLPVLVPQQLVHPLMVLGAALKLKLLVLGAAKGQVQALVTPRTTCSAAKGVQEEQRYQARLALHRTPPADPPPPPPSNLISRVVSAGEVGAAEGPPPLPVTYCSLREVQLAAVQQPPHPGPFLVQARLIGHYPDDLGDALVPVLDTAAGGSPRSMWLLKVLLEDATGQLDAVLAGPDADLFFGPGLSAADAAAAGSEAAPSGSTPSGPVDGVELAMQAGAAAAAVLDRLRARLQALEGAESEPGSAGAEGLGGQGPRWGQFCLQAAYYEASKAEVMHSYRIVRSVCQL
ncbi:hypothetical protein V8C86DRAFT_2917690 [Haematococcus lacustris]